MADSSKKMADKAADKLSGSDKAKDAIDAVGDKIDKLTGGRYADQVDKGQDLARDEMGKRKKGRSPDL